MSVSFTGREKLAIDASKELGKLATGAGIAVGSEILAEMAATTAGAEILTGTAAIGSEIVAGTVASALAGGSVVAGAATVAVAAAPFVLVGGAIGLGLGALASFISDNN